MKSESIYWSPGIWELQFFSIYPSFKKFIPYTYYNHNQEIVLFFNIYIIYMYKPLLITRISIFSVTFWAVIEYSCNTNPRSPKEMKKSLIKKQIFAQKSQSYILWILFFHETKCKYRTNIANWIHIRNYYRFMYSGIIYKKTTYTRKQDRNTSSDQIVSTNDAKCFLGFKNGLGKEH